MGRGLVSFCALLFALLAGLAATTLLIEPPSLRASSQPGQFDAQRAKFRLDAILGDQRPHPADSERGDAVRERLVAQIEALGLTPVIRDQFACNRIYKQRGVTCARVRNVIVRLGPPAGKALLLNAHYDSTPVGPAAGDDGVGIATMLDVAAVLKTERLARPVILLFNEGEELGLLGARAFLADPLSRSVDSLINLEARGTTGPVTMFETSLPSGRPVRAFAKAVDRPFANSLATDFYRQLPNYTDVNSFSERGWLTLNFAMIGNETRYHSPGDTLESLDLRSVQHMGDQALAVTRELANGRPGRSGDVLFADIAGRQLVVVPQWPGFGLLGLLVAGFAIIAARRGALWRSLGTFAAALLAGLALVWLGLFVIGEFRPGMFWRAFPLWSQLGVYASAILAAVTALAVIARPLTTEQLRAGYWLAFLLTGGAVLLIAPGGVIYFLFPPLLALGGILLSVRLPWAERAGAIAAAMAVWATLGEVLALLTELLNNGPLFVLAPLATLIAMPWLIEAKSLADKAGTRASTGSAALLLLGAWGAVAAAPAYSADRQQRYTIQHVTDTSGGKSYWSILNDGAPIAHGYGGASDWRWRALPYGIRERWLARAPALTEIRPPRLDRVASTRTGNRRTVSFRMWLNGAQSLTLIADESAAILSAGSNGFVQPAGSDAKGEYALSCSGRSCNGATMQFTTAAAKPLDITLIGSRPGLPSIAGRLLSERPRFARPQYAADSTLTISRLTL